MLGDTFRRAIAFSALLIAGLAAGGTALAAPGVGVSVGSIAVDDVLKPGGAYNLPEIGIINTGDEVREYEVTLQAVEADGAKQPEAKWFHFEPARFVLKPGESQPVRTRIVLPTGTEPGEYAAHLEAHPVAAGSFSIGVAAATKLSFTVQPASWFDAQRYRLNRWLDDNAPWTYIVPSLLVLGFLATRASRLPFRLRVERK